MSNPNSAVAAARQLAELSSCFESYENFAEVVQALEKQDQVTFDGVWGSSCALLATALKRHAPELLVVVLPDANSQDDLYDDLELFFGGRRERFPAWESELDDRVIHDDIYGERLRLLKSLVHTSSKRKRGIDREDSLAGASGLRGSHKVQPGSNSPLIVTSIQSLLQPVPSFSQVAENTRLLNVGDTVDVVDLQRWLVKRGFHNTSAVELPGEFSSRGGIVDIFAPDWIRPVRIEFFDNEIESIRQFDLATQRSLEQLRHVEVTVLLPSRQNDELFTAYLPAGSWILLIEPQRIEEEGRQYLQRIERPEQMHSVTEVLRQATQFASASASSLSAGSFANNCNLQVESVERFSGDLDSVRAQLEQVGEGNEVHLVAQTGAEIERLQEIFRNTNLAATGRLNYTVGSLNQGFRLIRDQMLLLSGSELFHRGELRRMPRRRLGKVIDSFLDLREGDLVVHLAHGIGRYRGLNLLDKDGQVEEFLEIEFHGRTKLHVPASKIDLVQKYIGGTKNRPTLAKIGGRSWQKHKQAAESAVMDLAAEMLELQATRASRPGIAFNQETDWQREFEASFPYQETPDQLTAWQAIRNDMHTARPMDRLLCGDVGFGKTEVAMRAAFKAVENGYQVAVLVPTTILAEQHFHTFCERTAEFPFEIAKLSRFCSTKEQREVVAGLESGSVDIVVGTHRLSSRDVKFCNLGLVIIDEEQRFGVEVKERLKTLRSTVDILTMTATPIPRTLHMSLVGVRDISSLETAPEDRIAVETRVTRFDAELIRHAVMRELNRGGQIFFVHNRVNDIEVLSKKLQHIVPEASIRIGHGQMHEVELEQVMIDFVAHKFDLLLATTIVESGLDIPNANTIFVDESDRYGLADLHQLRGRVGRYKHRAYCYMLVDPHKHITPNAAKRLRAIEEYSEMGAGFAIAMRDLEIRGAGNLLGTQQSGHIAAVGYELYCQLLETSVRQLKRMAPKLSVDVDIDLPGECFLPSEYVPDIRLRIDIYRRLSRAESIQQLAELREELKDRFGELPVATKRMLAQAELKMDATVWQVQAVFLEDRYLVFRYTQRDRIEQLARLCGKKLRIVDDSSAYLTLAQGVTDPDQIMTVARSVLQQ
jgi:transcription-repair coupling factor (superfamily II helicase)